MTICSRHPLNTDLHSCEIPLLYVCVECLTSHLYSSAHLSDLARSVCRYSRCPQSGTAIPPLLTSIRFPLSVRRVEGHLVDHDSLWRPSLNLVPRHQWPSWSRQSLHHIPFERFFSGASYRSRDEFQIWECCLIYRRKYQSLPQSLGPQ